MPREIVHWNVLEKVISRIRSTDAKNVSKCLSENKPSAFLGAMLHDAPYFSNFGKDPVGNIISERLHGKNGEDTFEPFRDIASQIISTEKNEFTESLWSALFGMITHYATDIYFHPMVYHLTGDYYDKDPLKRFNAQYRHRLFETYLDSWFKLELGEPEFTTFSQIIKKVCVNFEAVCITLDKSLNKNLIKHSWKKSISYMTYLQRAFLCDSLGMIVRGFDALSFGRLRKSDSMFQFGRKTRQHFFDGDIHYLNPATGENKSYSLIQLYEFAVNESVRLITSFETVLSSSGGSVPKTIMESYGISLNLGVIGTVTEDCKFLSNKPPAFLK